MLEIIDSEIDSKEEIAKKCLLWFWAAIETCPPAEGSYARDLVTDLIEELEEIARGRGRADTEPRDA